MTVLFCMNWFIYKNIYKWKLNRTWLACQNKSYWFLQKLEHSCITRENKLHWFSCVKQARLSFIYHIWCALCICVDLMFIYALKSKTSLHHIKLLCLFRSLGLNSLIHVDYFWRVFYNVLFETCKCWLHRLSINGHNEDRMV